LSLSFVGNTLSLKNANVVAESGTKEVKKINLKYPLAIAGIDGSKVIEVKDQEVKQEESKNYSRGGEEPKHNIKVTYNSNDVSILSNATELQLNELLKDTGLKGLGGVYIQAENTYEVNALFLIGVTALESYWGKSDLARTKNNLSGYYINGKPKYFSSKAECILETAKLISEEYLKEDGLYYKGKSIRAININYCELSSWTGKVNDIAANSKNKINNYK
jgi:beta-N-acetylglucosaminidase